MSHSQIRSFLHILLLGRYSGLSSVLFTSCSVMLISSSCCRNCSNMYLGAMSTRDWNKTFPCLFVPKEQHSHSIITRDLFLFITSMCHVSNTLNCLFTCLAEGVMPICTTMMARVMFSSCILWQYIFIVLIPTLGSSEDKCIPYYQKYARDIRVSTVLPRNEDNTIDYLCVSMRQHWVVSN